MLSSLFSNFAAACGNPSLFGFPTWYKYLKASTDINGRCTLDIHFTDAAGNLDLSAVTLIALGVLDIILRLAALVAVGYIIYAGVQYVTAQGEPDKAKKALGTIINAMVGLGITIVSAALVSFIGSRFGTQ